MPAQFHRKMLRRNATIVVMMIDDFRRALQYALMSAIFSDHQQMSNPTSLRARESNAAIQATFDLEFGSQSERAHTAIDDTIRSIQQTDKAVMTMPDALKLQQAHAISVAQKSVSDLLASLEMLRLGYHTCAHSILRTALESQALSMLISVDRNICNQYIADRFSSKDAVQKLLKRPELKMDANAKEMLRRTMDVLGKSVHPTVQSTAVQYYLRGNGGTPVGSSFDPAKRELYERHLRAITNAANNMTTMLRTRFLGNSLQS